MSEFITLIQLAQGWITSPRTMLTFFLAAGTGLGLLYLLRAQNAHYYFLLCFVLLVCGAGLVTHGLFDVSSRLKLWYRLNHLASDEEEVLNRFVEKNVSTIHATFAEPGANSLVDDGILRITSETGRVHQSAGITYYSILPRALRRLRKRKKR